MLDWTYESLREPSIQEALRSHIAIWLHETMQSLGCGRQHWTSDALAVFEQLNAGHLPMITVGSKTCHDKYITEPDTGPIFRQCSTFARSNPVCHPKTPGNIMSMLVPSSRGLKDQSTRSCRNEGVRHPESYCNRFVCRRGYIYLSLHSYSCQITHSDLFRCV